MTVGHEELLEVSRLHVRGRGGMRPGSQPVRRMVLPSFGMLGWSVGIGLATLLTRLVFAASGPTDWDAVQYVVGSSRFDVLHGAPQPPGYWLYVAGGHALHVATGLSATSSLVVLAALASAAAAALTCAAGTEFGGRWTGMASGVLVASAPVSWFAGSTVSSYGFDALVAAALVLLARRARPGGVHGYVAAAVYGLGAGFRPTILELFLPLVLIPVVASTRTVRQAVAVVGVALAGVAVWFAPTIALQPGGLSAWLHATRVEAAGAAGASSIFSTGAGGVTNLGTFASWTLLTLGPAVVIGLVAWSALALAGTATRRSVGDVTVRIWSRPGRAQPWYQHPGVVLAAAVLPPVAVVTLVQFAKGGYLLSYLPAATIGVLMPAARLVHHRRAPLRRAALLVGSGAVVLACAWNVERFTEAPGILPASVVTGHPGWWISQARYQAPYADTASAIAAADRADRALTGLGRRVDPRTDVLVVAGMGTGADLFRNVGFALPDVRVSLVSPSPPVVLYTELHGLLYYRRGSVVAVAPGGHAWILTAPSAPDLSGRARPFGTEAGFRLWRVSPGAVVLGVRVVAVAGARPLGGGIR